MITFFVQSYIVISQRKNGYTPEWVSEGKINMLIEELRSSLDPETIRRYEDGIWSKVSDPDPTSEKNWIRIHPKFFLIIKYFWYIWDILWILWLLENWKRSPILKDFCRSNTGSNPSKDTGPDYELCQNTDPDPQPWYEV